MKKLLVLLALVAGLVTACQPHPNEHPPEFSGSVSVSCVDGGGYGWIYTVVTTMSSAMDPEDQATITNYGGDESVITAAGFNSNGSKTATSSFGVDAVGVFELEEDDAIYVRVGTSENDDAFGTRAATIPPCGSNQPNIDFTSVSCVSGQYRVNTHSTFWLGDGDLDLRDNTDNDLLVHVEDAFASDHTNFSTFNPTLMESGHRRVKAVAKTESGTTIDTQVAFVDSPVPCGGKTS